MDFSIEAISRIIDLMPGNVAVYRLYKGTVHCVRFSSGIPAMLRRTTEELAAYNDPFDLILPQDRDIVRQKFMASATTAEDTTDYLFHMDNKTPGGIWARMVANRTKGDDGAFYFIASFADATKEMLVSSTIMDITDRYICVIEKKTKRFLYGNAQFCKLVNTNPDDAVGKFCYEVLCKNAAMAQSDECLCYSSLTSEKPIELYWEQTQQYFALTGREIAWGEYDAYVFQMTDLTEVKKDKQLLEASLRRFNVALDNSDLMIWEYDMVNNRCINSEKAQRDYHVPLVIEDYPESLFLTGYTPPETIEQIRDCKRRLFNGETGFSVERRTVDINGKSHWQKVDYALECDESGKPLRAIVCGMDITAKKELEKKYQEQVSARNTLAQSAMFSILMDLDDDAVINLQDNMDAGQDFTYSTTSASDFLQELDHFLIRAKSGNQRVEHYLSENLKGNVLLGRNQYQTSYHSKRLNKYLEISITVTRNPGTGHLDAFLQVQDITGNALMYDLLTGLYNREKSYLECIRLLRDHPDERFVMMHFDIQRFRLYNTFFGEQEGDRLLVYIADIFRALARQHKTSVYGRIEGDVFLFCLPYTDEIVESVQGYVHNCLVRYRKDFQLLENCGVYIIHNRNNTPEACFNMASVAAKNNAGRQLNPLAYYDDVMRQKLADEQAIQQEMRHALETEQFKVYLQPKYKLISGEPFGAEALVRWVHPEKGVIGPAQFIPVFETNGFIATLDRYMWEHVCQLLRKWLDEGITPAPVSVNMSRISMYSPQTVSFLAELVRKYRLPPALLNLELTESAYMDDPDAMKQRLSALRQLGFQIMMDDFGSGFSSLNTLRDIPVDYLKVDRLFLASIEQDTRSRLVLAAVIRMATSMDIPVITEGVETDVQNDFLTSIGCDFVQGFFYAKPMPAEEYEEKFVRGHTAPPAKSFPEIPSDLMKADLDIDFQRYANLLPYDMVFVDCVGDTFTYTSANTGFVKTFGLHRDVTSQSALLAMHLSREDYDALHSAYQQSAQTRQPTQCRILWRDAEGHCQRYLVRAQYLGKTALSTMLTAAFIPLSEE